jgi:hypothetical protein
MIERSSATATSAAAVTVVLAGLFLREVPGRLTWPAASCAWSE